MKKHIFALGMAAAMCFNLVGCSNGNNTESTTAANAETTASVSETSSGNQGDTKNVKITFAWWGNQTRNDRTQEVLNMYSAANPGVVFDSQPSQFSDYFTKLSTAAAGGTLPDLIQMNTTYMGQYESNGLLADLTPYVENGILDVSTIDESVLAAGSMDGKLYAICSGLNVPALIYNKTLTDELGIEVDDSLTMDRFIEISREIYEKTGIKTDLAYGNPSGMMEFIMRGEAAGGVFDGDALAATSSEAFEPYFKIYEMGKTEGWMIDAATYAELILNSVEQCPLVYYSSPAAQSWCACYWSNQLQALQKAAPEGTELAYATWPSNNLTKSNYLHPSMYFCVSANSKNLEESVKVLNYLINDLDCNKVLLAERGIPAPSAVSTGIEDALSEESRKEIAFINDVIIPNSSEITPPDPEEGTEIYALANELIEKVLYGELTAKEASAQFFDGATAIFNR